MVSLLIRNSASFSVSTDNSMHLRSRVRSAPISSRLHLQFSYRGSVRRPTAAADWDDMVRSSGIVMPSGQPVRLAIGGAEMFRRVEVQVVRPRDLRRRMRSRSCWGLSGTRGEWRRRRMRSDGLGCCCGMSCFILYRVVLLC